MKKNKLLLPLSLFGAMLLVLPACQNLSSKEEPMIPAIEADNVSYDMGDSTVRLKDFTYVPKDDADVVIIPNKVIIHYHNDDNACNTRRFYTWVTGQDGIERKPDAETWTSTDMSIVLDFNEIPAYKDMTSIFFIIKVAGTWAGQSEDVEVRYEDYQDCIQGDTMEIWCIPGEGKSIEIYATEEETKLPKIQTAKFTDWKTIHCVATTDANGKKWIPSRYRVYAFDRNYLTSSESVQKADKEFYLFKSGKPNANEFDITFNYSAKINIQYVIESEFDGINTSDGNVKVQKIIVGFENLYESDRFEQYYTYDGDDLGMTYTPTATTFKVWSPISAAMTLNLYDTGTPSAYGGDDSFTYHQMFYKQGGVWEITVNDDLKGQFYTFSCVNANGTVETVDPYVKAVGINGARGYVYDKDSAEANPDGWDTVPSIWDGREGYDIESPQDLSIYEVHIRDLTMDESWVSNKGIQRGTYKAFSEDGTHLAGDDTITTGYAHIKELGVNAVQLLPVFDHDDDERPEKMKFNWGYNPLNYNCVEGGYSSDPYNPLSRIKEYKELIKAYSENGNHTRIIMDVVYNHVSSASASCFTKIMPKYYFRYNENWEYMDGSGCNNEVKSDATMMRKFIVDSLVWWATEYKIKGFRFDLMGLIDTWTMRAAKEAMYKIDKDIYVYGEGWTSGGYHGKYETDGSGQLINGGAETALVYSALYESGKSRGFVGGFNNGGRDYLKGSNDNGYNGSPYPQWGFISQGSGDVGDKADRVGDMIKGANPYVGGLNPKQTVNYASCHDNYTLWDQLRYTLAPNGYYSYRYTDDGVYRDYDTTVQPIGDEEPDTTMLVNATLAAHASVFFSNGASFIQGGEELYRSKTYTEEELAKVFDGDYTNAENVVRPFGLGSSGFKHYSTNPDDILATSEVWMYGKVTSHNSYKSTDAINAFKWDRKVSVNGTDVRKYNQVWKDMVHAKQELKKYSYEELYPSGYLDTSKMSTWGNGNGSTILAAWSLKQNGQGYHFFLTGRNGSSISLDHAALANPANCIFATDASKYSYSNSTVSLGEFAFVCYKIGF